MKIAISVLALIYASFATASNFSERSQRAYQETKQSYESSAMNSFVRNNTVYQRTLTNFAKKFGGLAQSSTCKVGTGYDCSNPPCTPHGSMNIPVSAIGQHAGATFECDLDMGNGLACRVDTNTTMGGVFNYPANCRSGKRAYLWAECIDGNRQRQYHCQK